MSSNLSSQSPKAQLLSKVSHLQGAEARAATKKAWDENTVKMLYRRNVQPPVSQPHADHLMAEEQWFDACKNHDYPWLGQVNTNGISEPLHPRYFHYWFERKQLDAAKANDAVAEGEMNPLLIADKHAIAWEKVITQEKGILSKTTKKQLVDMHEGVKQQTREAQRLAWECKKTAATAKEQSVRRLEAERNQHRELRQKYHRLKNDSRQGDHGVWGQQVVVESDADEQQRLIQANHIQALEGKFDKNADSINERLDENRELKLKLSGAQAKIVALEIENDKLREESGKGVKVKNEELPALPKLEDIQWFEVNQEDQSSRKRKCEDMNSDNEDVLSEDEI